MPNQIRFPYGNAYIVGTPHLDQLGNHIYAQEQQNKLYKQKQDEALDNEFAKNVTGIKDADIGKFTEAYNDYKQARMQTLRQGKVTPQQQMDVLKKQANMYDVIKKSKTEQAYETDLGHKISNDTKGIFADDAHQRLMQRIQTPYDQINHDDDQKFLYPYSIPDLSKELKTARGEEKEVPITLGQNPNDKFKDDKEVYKVGNNPNQFFNGLTQGVLASNKVKNFAGIVNQKYNEQELQDLENKYWAKVSDPKFQQVYGKPEAFPEYANNTDLGKAAKIETMEEFVNKPLIPTKKVSEVNQERVKANQQDFARHQQQRSFNHAVQMQRVGFGHTDAKSEKEQTQNNQWIDGFIDDGIEKSKNYPVIDGARTVPLDPVSSKALAKGQIQPSALSISDDGNTFTPIYPTYDASGNPTPTPNASLSQPMDRNGIKLALGYKTLTKKDLGGAMQQDAGDVKIQIGGKIYKVPKTNLSKLDSDKVKYKVIQ